jgi:GT2 family glycosyltransferase
VDGKFFRIGEKKFFARGVSYGPFAPNAAGLPFAPPEETARDFAHIRELRANLIRVYSVPGKWFLDLAAEHQLMVLVDIPWPKRLAFLDSRRDRAEAVEAVRRGVFACARHPAVFAFNVANEIPADIVRWSGADRVADLIDELITEAKRVDAECLCTYTNFPPTEFLRPACVDFVGFNVYLHQRAAFRKYLARLQLMAEAKPLVLTEFGFDSLRQGEVRKSEMLEWQIEDLFRGGLAGGIVFSYTDDWWHEGKPVGDWFMGLTTREREPKESFGAVGRMYGLAPYFAPPRFPRVSVVVAGYNGDRTLKACLDSLLKLNYPDYEVILVDDGSTDTTPRIASQFPNVRYLRHETNRGLSVARNTGIGAASGEIVAFTDSDCRADEDWLHYLVAALVEGEYAGVGGPNLLPPEDSLVAAAVTASPGGPAHVMLTDRQAEHIPGCNMAFFKWALVEAGGFDPIFTKAGDDVDICWRVQQAGHVIGFSPAAFVWHYRRSTVADYLRQQQGYGEAEALLVRKHPEYFNTLGGSVWRGRIYASSGAGLRLRRSIIYRGLFGGAGHQFVYATEPSSALMFCASLEYHVLVTLPLWVVSVVVPYFLPVAVVSALASAGVCVAAAAQAALPRDKERWWSRPLVALLFLLQPLVRGWARYRGRLALGRPARLGPQASLDSIALRDGKQPLDEARYRSGNHVDRLAVVADIARRLDQQGWPNRSDTVWNDYDVEIYDTRWSRLQLTTAREEHPLEREVVRFRLRARWSLRAKAAFWALCGIELWILGFLGPGRPWLWGVLLAPPLFIWFLRRENRNLQSVVRIFLDEVAKENGLEKVI